MSGTDSKLLRALVAAYINNIDYVVIAGSSWHWLAKWLA